jgi:hypothetical protein
MQTKYDFHDDKKKFTVLQKLFGSKLSIESFSSATIIVKLLSLKCPPSYLKMNSELRILCVNDCYKPERFSMLKTLRGLHNGPGETKLGINANIYPITSMPSCTCPFSTVKSFSFYHYFSFTRRFLRGLYVCRYFMYE